MRKILLGTTAVAGFALFAVSTAQAQQAPTVSVGGYVDFSYGNINDDADKNLSSGVSVSQSDFRVDTEVVVNVLGKAANGLTYGARIEFEMDAVGVGSAGTAFNTDEVWMFASSPTLGTIRLGDTDSAAGIMQVRPSRYTGFNGARVNWTVQGGTRYTFAGMNDGADNSKVVYMSPEFAGFDFGVSFAPNGGEGEREIRGLGISEAGAVTAAGLQRGGIDRENEITAALRYRGQLGAVGIAAGAAMSTASAPSNTRTAPIAAASQTDDPTAYSVGLSLTFAGLTVGGEYTWGSYNGVGPGNTGTTKGFDDSNHWLLGASYTIQGITLTANYGEGTQDRGGALADHTSTIIGVGASYTLAPGWTLYGYYESVSDDNLPAAIGGVASGRNRDTQAFVLGTALAF